MKTLLAGVIGVLITSTAAFATTCTEQFSWIPGADANIQGYTIHYGHIIGGPYSESMDAGKPVPVNGRMITAVSKLTCGTTYYFVAASYDETGAKSYYSNEVKVSVTAPSTSDDDEIYPFITNVSSE